MALSAPILLVIIGISSLAAQWLAWLLRLPAILPLLVFGILLGPVTHILQPDLLFGNLLFPLVSLSVAIILFEGALTLRFEEIRGLGGVVRNLVTIGMLITFLVITLACLFLLHLPAGLSALVGAVTVVTGPTVIAPLMRVVRPKNTINQVLRWEGIIIDPVGAIFTLLVFEFIVLHQKSESYIHLFLTLGKTVGVGLAIGAIAGWITGVALRRVWLPGYLQNFAVLAIMLGVFGLSNLLADESGLLTVTVMGIWLANMRDLDLTDIIEFKEQLSALLISGLFIILASRVDIGGLFAMGWPLVGVLLVIQFVARPLCIAASTLGSSLHWRDRLLLCWIAPRGIVAAAVSSLFALTLAKNGYPGADRLISVVFAIIIGTVVLQSLTSLPMARWLRVQKKQPRGVLIVGANSVARALALALQKQDLPVQVTDNSWENYRQARMEGLPAYFGYAWSEHAENYLDLNTTSRVLAMSSNRHQNALAAYHFSHILGKNKVAAIRSGSGVAGRGKNDRESPRFRRQETLFSPEYTFGHLSRLISSGATIKATRLSENFGWDDYLEKNHGAIPLFSLDEEKKLHPVSSGQCPALPCTLIALVQNEALEADSR
ncbi:cation:proton antiporter [Tatumella citrea]|uniref:Sodium:proton exchanger n=1 Tax=Tatumella citrea TaxID=53336 RepID=A0A1Y0LP73_TATCI|nr:sodium:proton antiporter [Tatumella citrea]ARU95499.1 sodium:proton exchanger [Tatumella citrea]ARU99540.1 sodium:proton exchanger [Tatumella citrea]